jgi:hypothetical protein
VSGCTWARQLRGRALNGLGGPIISWSKHLAWLLNGQFGHCVPAGNVTTKKRKVKREVYKDLFKNKFVENYKRWIFHGEERARIREEEVRAHLEEYDGDAGMADMVVDYNEACGNEGLVEEDPEETAKAFYEMMSLA